MKTIYLVHHTHWDYEWYFTENESTIQLIYHVNELLNAIKEQKVDNYLLDGQTSLIESYLKYCPDKEEELVRNIRNGTIKTGPWYTQTDQFLVDYESVYQNLRIGIADCQTYGVKPKVAYVPDSFGQNEEIIGLYKNLGLNHLVFWRGLDPNDVSNVSFAWKDQHHYINALNLRFGYYRGYNLYDDNLSEFIAQYEKEFSGDIILPVGGDQRAVDIDINEIITKFNMNSSDYQMQLISYDDLVELQDYKPKYEGELLNAIFSKIHRSIYSNRVDLKMLNSLAENLIINQTTPLMLIASNLGLEYEEKLIEEIWRELLKNHAHDSACHCNSDRTNQQIKNRLINVIEKLLSINDYIIRKITEANCKENEILLFNTLGFDRSLVQELKINTKLKNFILLDDDGNEMMFELVNTVEKYSGSITEDELDCSLIYYESQIKLSTEISAYDIKKIIVKEIANIRHGDTNDKDNVHDLSSYAIVVEDDAGDNYDFSYSRNHTKQIINLTEFNRVDKHLEKRITHNNKTIELKIILSQVNQKLAFDIEIKNVDNAGFRIQFIYLKQLESSYHKCRGIGKIKKRKNIDNNMSIWEQKNHKEMPSSIYPMNGAVRLCKNNWIIAPHIKEYEIVDDMVAITLLRSVSFLGKPNLIRRPGIASGQEYKWTKTPDSEMKGTYNFKIYIGDYTDEKINKEYLNCVNQLLYYQVQEYNRFTGPLKYFTSNVNENLKLRDYFLKNIDVDKNLDILGIDKIENKLSLRLYNPTKEKISYRNIWIESDEIVNVELREEK